MNSVKTHLIAFIVFCTCGCSVSDLSPLENSESKKMCPKIARWGCFKLGAGIYIERSMDTEPAPSCKFIDKDTVDPILCSDSDNKTQLFASTKEQDGKQFSVTGEFESLTSESELSCAKAKPSTGEPEISGSYYPDLSGYGLRVGDQQLKSEFAETDARSNQTDYFKDIPIGARITLHGTFKYRTVTPPCGDGSIVHPSGSIVLELQ